MSNLKSLLIVIALGAVAIIFLSCIVYLVSDANFDYKHCIQSPATWIPGIILWLASVICYNVDLETK
jgi:NADH:ubiquinone oxidoreductase subunit 6 (subunit J)